MSVNSKQPKKRHISGTDAQTITTGAKDFTVTTGAGKQCPSRLIWFMGGTIFGMFLLIISQFIKHPKADKPVQVVNARHYVNEDGWIYTKDASGAKRQVVTCE